MSGRRLVQNNRFLQDRRHGGDEEIEDVDLPPYEPPSCILTAKARAELNKLHDQEDELRRYQKHLNYSTKVIPKAVSELNDRSKRRKDAAERYQQKRIKDGKTDDDRTKDEVDEDVMATSMTKNGKDMTQKCEKAMRDIIDYSDEKEKHRQIMQQVIEGIDAGPAPDDVREEEEAEGDKPSAVTLLESAREDYYREYNSQSMLKRYENTDYNIFKKLLHDAMHGDTGNPLPKASLWFTENKPNIFYESGRIGGNGIDDGGDEDDDDDVVIQGSKDDYKCPLTFSIMREPYSSKVCKHSFEKEAIVKYVKDGPQFADATGARVRQVLCPQVGCEKGIKLADLYDDDLLRRKIQRHLDEIARMNEEDEDEDNGNDSDEED